TWVPCPRLCVGMIGPSIGRGHAHAEPWAWHATPIGSESVIFPLSGRLPAEGAGDALEQRLSDPPQRVVHAVRRPVPAGRRGQHGSALRLPVLDVLGRRRRSRNGACWLSIYRRLPAGRNAERVVLRAGDHQRRGLRTSPRLQSSAPFTDRLIIYTAHGVWAEV